MSLRKLIGLILIAASVAVFAFLVWALYHPDAYGLKFAFLIGIPGALMGVLGAILLLVAGEALFEAGEDEQAKRVASDHPLEPRNS